MSLMNLRLLSRLPCALPLVFGLASGPAAAQEHAHTDHAAPYAGYQTRPIKSLSQADIEALRRGDGWGLALPAELSGLPGPVHLLQLSDALALSAEQVAAIEEIEARMRADAIAAGERFIAAEAALSAAFEAGDLDEDALRALLDASAAARAELRFVHLAAHLAVRPLLTEEQVRRYAILRGYAEDPCATVPAGHDPAMWRRHNGCQ